MPDALPVGIMFFHRKKDIFKHSSAKLKLGEILTIFLPMIPMAPCIIDFIGANALLGGDKTFQYSNQAAVKIIRPSSEQSLFFLPVLCELFLLIILLYQCDKK